MPEYEVLHIQSREYIVDDLLDVMKEGGGSMILYHGSFLVPGKIICLIWIPYDKIGTKTGANMFCLFLAGKLHKILLKRLS